ncbi:MAG: T9SS type A sorting domain-containing protein [Crocinitomix sp.]|nr:T9SS type A sorting domain-containing protein [Crocinitomix sp.]
MKSYLFLLLLIIQSIQANSQKFEWGVVTDARATAIQTDGSVIRSGRFEASVDLDPGLDVFIVTADSETDFSVFIQKLDAEGNFLWGKTLGYSFDVNVSDILVNEADEIYLWGNYKHELDADPGPEVTWLPNDFGFDCYLIKLDADGNFIWGKSIGANVSETASKIEMTPSGDIVLTGTFDQAIDCDPGPLDYPLPHLGGLEAHNNFIIKLNADGEFSWAKNLGVASDDETPNISVLETDNAENIYVAGNFLGTMDFDPSGSEFELTATGEHQGYVQKLDADGNFVWVKTLALLTPTSQSTFNAIAFDEENNVTLGGSYFGTVDFDMGAGTDSYTSNEAHDGFILKIDGGGGAIWTNFYSSPGLDHVIGLSTITDDHIIATGSFSGLCDFDNSANFFNLIPEGLSSTFVLELNAAGQLIWVKAIDGTSNVSNLELQMGSLNEIHICGKFNGTVDLNPGAAELEYTTPSPSDENYQGYVVKLSQCPVIAPFDSHIASSCDSYIWDVNGHTYSETGLYRAAIESVAGCDSIVSLNLTIIPIDNSVTQDGTTLTADLAGASYQWVRCDADYTPIDGATGQSYNVVTDGIYAVIISDDACTDTSECFSYLHFSIDEAEQLNFIVYPNPTKGDITIVFDQLIAQVLVRFYTLTGKLMFEDTFSNQKEYILSLQLPRGIYLLELVQGSGKIERIKIVIQ